MANEDPKPAPAAKQPSTIVLLQDLHDPSGKLLPAGTELDPKEPWVARCVVPFDLWETKSVFEAKKKVATAVAEAEAVGKELMAKARAGAE